MLRVSTSLLLAFGQLADARVLRILVKSLLITLLLVGVLAWAGWHALDWGLARAGLGEEVFYGAADLRGIASFVIAAIMLWLVWRIVAMTVIQFFADEVVQAVEARHYPHAASAAREPSLRQQVAESAKAATRTLIVNLVALPFALALLVTGIGTALLFWLVNAVLLGREFQDMVWLRHRTGLADAAPIGRGERLALGGAIAALLLVPFVNFLAPILGAAAATHLVHRRR